MKIKDRAKPKLPPIEPGTYLAACVGIIDLGEQYSEMFKSFSPKLQIVFEICGETVTVDGEEQPRQLSKDFTFSASKKSNLRGFLSTWAGKNYSDEEFSELEIFDFLGKPCQLSVVLNETKEYANIQGILGLPKGLAAPPPTIPFITWDMDQWDDAAFEQLPEWVQEKIKKSTQYQKDHAPKDELKIPEEGAAPGEGGCPI